VTGREALNRVISIMGVLTGLREVLYRDLFTKLEIVTASSRPAVI